MLGNNSPFPAVLYLERSAGGGIESRPTHLFDGMNSGFQALQLAIHMGAAHVLLFGFDMHRPRGQSHWFGDHPPPLYRESPYAAFVKYFADAAPLIKARGVQVTNCTPGSAITCFETADPYELLESLSHGARHAALPA